MCVLELPAGDHTNEIVQRVASMRAFLNLLQAIRHSNICLMPFMQMISKSRPQLKVSGFSVSSKREAHVRRLRSAAVKPSYNRDHSDAT